MKNFILRTTWLIVLILIITNLFIFISGIVLSDEINNFELKTDSLRKTNLILEKESANLSSLQFAQKQAEKLHFINSSLPQSLDKLGYAYRP